MSTPDRAGARWPQSQATVCWLLQGRNNVARSAAARNCGSCRSIAPHPLIPCAAPPLHCVKGDSRMLCAAPSRRTTLTSVHRRSRPPERTARSSGSAPHAWLEATPARSFHASSSAGEGSSAGEDNPETCAPHVTCEKVPGTPLYQVKKSRQIEAT